MEFKLNCKMEKKVSKSGKDYIVLYIEDISKQVFLTDVEYKYLNVLFGKK